MSTEGRRRPGIRAAIVGAGILIVAAGLLFARKMPDQLPPALFPMPSFALVDESGNPYGSDRLAGNVVVADFIFTSCPTICPTLSARMARLQNRLAAQSKVHLVSFTVDPGHDTPEVLRSYGQQFGQDPGKWTFLTGDSEAMRKAIEQGFKIGIKGEGINLTHGDHLVLVDARGQIRGYYGNTEEDRLVRDVLALSRTTGS